MNTIGLWGSFNKEETTEVANQIEEWLRARDCKVFRTWEEFKQHQADCIISLGGDGTLLETARESARWAIPVLGINLGRLGFLCEIERNEMWNALECILKGAYTIQERVMLNARIDRNGLQEIHVNALNDVVFAREFRDGQITLQANISGEPSVSYPADGLIVSTPTGSTGYSLSAGGPILSPDVKAFVITPLAAHSLSARSMVVSQDEMIEIILMRGKSCRVTFDGQYHVSIGPNERTVIRASDLKAKLIHLGTRSFPKVVREKLMDRWHD